MLLSAPGLGSPVQLSTSPPFPHPQPATRTPGQGVPFSEKGIHILPLDSGSLHGFLLLGTEMGLQGFVWVCLVGQYIVSYIFPFWKQRQLCKDRPQDRLA